MSQHDRRRLIGMLLTLGALAVPLTAAAMCGDEPPPIERIAKAQETAFAKLKAGPDGVYYDRFEGSTVTMTAAFADLTGPQKLEKAARAAFAFQGELTPEDEAGLEVYVGSPLRVVDHLDRFVGSYHPCASNLQSVTEHQRYLLTFKTGLLRDEDNPKFRLRRGIRMADVKEAFHGVMSWKADSFIAWVPEGGFFEINLANEAELAKLAAFWPRAPKGYRYEVLLNDGTRIARKQL